MFLKLSSRTAQTSVVGTWTSSGCPESAQPSIFFAAFIFCTPLKKRGQDAPIPIAMADQTPTELERPAPRPIKTPKPETKIPIPAEGDLSVLHCFSEQTIVDNDAKIFFCRTTEAKRYLGELQIMETEIQDGV